jgi:hypothetical protein
MALIDSVEYVEIEIATGETTDTASLTKGQTIANCVPFMTRQINGTSSNWDQVFLDVEFEAGPKVRVTRDSSGGTMSIGITVVEFGSNVTVQSGSYSMSGGSTTETISAVTLSKTAMIHFYKATGVGTTSMANTLVRGSFNSTTQLLFDREDTDGSISGHWYLFEANGTEFSVQHVEHIISFGTTEETTTISSVTMNKTMLISSFKSDDTIDDVENSVCSVNLASSTSIYSEREFGAVADVTCEVFVIEFDSGQDPTVQRGQFDYGSGDTTDSDTISSVIQAVSMPHNAQMQGIMQAAGDTAASTENCFQRVKLTSSTNVAGLRTSGFVATGYWEVVQWVATTYDLTGVTKDYDGNILGGCDCFLLKDNGDDTLKFVDYVLSNASTGVYLFEDIVDNDSAYLVVAWKDDTPHVYDVTDHVLTPS